MCVRTVILMMSLIFLGCGNVNDTSTLVSEDGAPEYTASRSLLYSWYFNHPTCFQHKARHDKINDGKQFMSAFRANKDCPRIPDRPKSCSGGGLWKDRPFLVDGTCPTTIFSTSHWRPRDKDGRPGYSFSMSDDKHPVITLKNQAFGVEGKFQHKEASFGFHEFAEQLIKRPDGTNHSPFDFDALLVEFDAKAKMTRSKKTKKDGSRFQVTLMYRFAKDGDPDQRNAKTGGRKNMQHSLVVHLHDPQGRSKADRKKRYGRTDVFYSNYCSESGKGTPECHINIDGTDPAIKPYITTRRGKNGFTNYQVNFSKIIKHFYCKGSEPASKKTNCHLITPKAWKKNRSNSTYISSVIFHTGATQADEVVNVRNINVRGVPKSPPVKQEKPQQISREGEESEGEESEISVASAFREER